MLSKFKIVFALIFSSLGFSVIHAEHDVITMFPLNNYDQNISTWIKPSSVDYNKPLLSVEMQKKRMAIFYDHYFGLMSPWSGDYINQILRSSQPNDIVTVELKIINNFNNDGKPNNEIGYSVNFRPYDKQWIADIVNNINLSQFSGLSYQSKHCGIAIENLYARALPTDDVYFYSYKIAGQGYPFDNLQMSALWIGTPVYIIGETLDHAWMMVVTPDYIGWVKSRGIAHVDTAFITKWSNAAKNQLATITKTKTSLVDEKGKFLSLAYVGSVFPAQQDPLNIKLMVPTVDADGYALIKNANVPVDHASIIPIATTPHNFAEIMKSTIGRPYGWGNMYLYNDCSSELKNLLVSFGIWIPRHSSDQIKAGKIIDLSQSSIDERLSYLTKHGEKFLTLIYIGGHIIMYIGNYQNNNELVSMTYQNLWGLKSSAFDTRAVIGEAVLFPLLSQYPENTSLISLAGGKYFQLSFLSQIPLAKIGVATAKSLMLSDE